MAKTTSAGTQTTLLTDETFTAAPGAPVSITITGGTIDGVSAGVTTPFTKLCVDNLCIDGSIISSVTGNIYLTPIAGSNITLDGATTIDGGVVVNSGTFTNTGDVTVTGTQTITGDLKVDNLSLNGNTISSLSGDVQLKAFSGSNLTLQDDQSATKEVSLDMSIVPQGTDRKWRFPTGLSGTEHFVGETENQTLKHKILHRPVIEQGFLKLPQVSGLFPKNHYQIQPSDITGDRVAKLPKLTSNDEFVFSKHTQTLTNKTLTSPVLNTSVTGTGIKDEDNMASDSATHLATQQSIKAYVDAGGGVADNSVTGAKIAMGSDAQGDILYYNGTDYARLGFGTSGYFLKTQGTGANPIWAESTGGGPSYGSGDEWVRYNSNQINENITVAVGKNASSVGPITVGSSYAVTVNGVYTVI